MLADFEKRQNAKFEVVKAASGLALLRLRHKMVINGQPMSLPVPQAIKDPHSERQAQLLAEAVAAKMKVCDLGQIAPAD